MEDRDEKIAAIVDAEVDGMDFDSLLQAYKSYRVTDLESVDNDTIDNLHSETCE